LCEVTEADVLRWHIWYRYAVLDPSF
jgi:hypothetical protein